MNVYRIYLFIDWFDFTSLLIFVFDTKGENIVFVFTFTPLLMIDKMGEKDFEFIYAYLSFCMYWVYALCLCIFCFVKLGEWFWKFKQKGGEFLEKGFWIYVLSLTLLMHICLFSFMYFIEYIFVYCYAWVKGELL